MVAAVTGQACVAWQSRSAPAGRVVARQDAQALGRLDRDLANRQIRHCLDNAAPGLAPISQQRRRPLRKRLRQHPKTSAWAGRIAVANTAIHPLRRFTLKVMGNATHRTVDVAADATGLTSRAGTSLLALTAQRLGLIDALSEALCDTRKRRSAHDPGRVFGDLAVMAADGGRCVSDLSALAGQPALFGNVCSVPTARRVLHAIGELELDRIRGARALARQRAWAAGAAPERVILDFDAPRSPSTPRRRTPPAITRAAMAFILCWFAAAGRCSPAS